ncbi:hypothetical protein [Vibrio sp. Hep-1b-8]|uniref:hypothetical protein n=1 Tax=Vibrio sp. Hep-1b-8 TaxID=2144187 RepID=UPI00111086B3|nr:hypothetical protein [Vibrio sp. Hep-1b-8]TMX47433.1 hypothetical protein DA100_00525 [Vibrio sp. Hep-1b-8]
MTNIGSISCVMLFIISTISYAIELEDVRLSAGSGLLIGTDGCSESYYQCDLNSIYYEFGIDFESHNLALGSSILIANDFEAQSEKTQNRQDFNIKSLNTVTKYKYPLGHDSRLDFGIGLSIWKDKQYGISDSEHVGSSAYLMLAYERYVNLLDLNVSSSVKYFPNFYGLDFDMLLLGVSFSKSQIQRRIKNAIENSQDKSNIDYQQVVSTTLYFDESSSLLTSSHNLTQFLDGDYFVVYGYRSYNEDIIVSIDRARRVESALKELYPNSKIDIINMSYTVPYSAKSNGDGYQEERRVIIKSYRPN